VVFRFIIGYSEKTSSSAVVMPACRPEACDPKSSQSQSYLADNIIARAVANTLTMPAHNLKCKLLRINVNLSSLIGGALQGTEAVITRVVAAFLLAIVGGGISSIFAISHERLCRLISLAAGTLLGVTLFSIIPEVYHAVSLWGLLLALLSGYAVFYLVSHYVFHVCPACAASHFDEAATHRFSEIAGAMIIALSLHSTMDGLALAMGRDAELSGGLNASLLLAICVHKLPEGLTLCALLLASGFRRVPALGIVAAVEATTLLGGFIGLWAAPWIGGFWVDIILAHVGGGFIYLAIHAVFGELVRHSKKLVLINFGVGLILIAVLDLALHL
jgi:zinc transporter ZupT